MIFLRKLTSGRIASLCLCVEKKQKTYIRSFTQRNFKIVYSIERFNSAAIAFSSEDRRFDHGNRQQAHGCRGAGDVVQHAPMLLRIGDDAAAPDFAAPDFKLRLDERNDRRVIGKARGERRKNLCKRDERYIYGCQIEAGRELKGIKVAGVLAFDDDDARILAQLPRQLIVADINRPHTRRAVLQQTIGEAPRRSTCIERSDPNDDEAECVQSRVELVSSARYEPPRARWPSKTLPV